MGVTFSRVTFRVFPRDDEQFAAIVESLTGSDEGAGDRLEEHLRAVYPRAVVRQRDSLGELDPAAQTWYVYRDGTPLADGGS